MAGQKDALLFAALASASEQRMGDFNPQNIANTAWAFPTGGIRAPELMHKVSAAAFLLIEQFDSVDLLKFLCGYEWAGSQDKSWGKAVASEHMCKYRGRYAKAVANASALAATLSCAVAAVTAATLRSRLRRVCPVH